MADSRAILKAFFETGDVPTEAEFASLIDGLFALNDDNTVEKVIIVNVPTVGDGSGGKILKRGDAVIAMGEFITNAIIITSDNGAFAAGGTIFNSPAETALFFDGKPRVSAKVNTLTLHRPDGVVVLTISSTGIDILDNIKIFGGVNIILDETTGNKIGTSTTQKLAFWNQSPDTQPAHIADADGTLADLTTKFNALLAQMAATGLQATS